MRKSRETATPVLFVGGSGRSGSTLVERLVGGLPGYVNIGEVLDLPRQVVVEDELCGCGQPFSDCEFWTEVGKRLSSQGGDVWSPEPWSRSDLDRLGSLQNRVARQRHFPRLLLNRPAAFRSAVREYGRRYDELFQAIRETSSARYVVDASKWPAQLLALHRGGVDVRALHIVRDVRAVSHSLSKVAVARPHARQGGHTAMHSRPPMRGAARWLATQTEMDAAAAVGLPTARIFYSDLIADPVRTLTDGLTRLGFDVPDGGFAYVHVTADGYAAELGASHGLSGNPSRFATGEIRLRPDDQWQRAMTPAQQRLTLLIGGPQVLRYGLEQRIR